MDTLSDDRSSKARQLDRAQAEAPLAPSESRAVAISASRSAAEARDGDEADDRPTDTSNVARFWAGWDRPMCSAPPSRLVQWLPR